MLRLELFFFFHNNVNKSWFRLILLRLLKFQYVPAELFATQPTSTIDIYCEFSYIIKRCWRWFCSLSLCYSLLCCCAFNFNSIVNPLNSRIRIRVCFSPPEEEYASYDYHYILWQLASTNKKIKKIFPIESATE